MAIIKKYKTEVSDIKNPIPDIYVVSFKSLDKPFRFFPGQFLHLALDDYNPSDPWPESRCFSIQTSSEDEVLKITYAVKGVFTKRMAIELAAGKSIYLKMPYGDLFTRPHNNEKTVFIAGGTGITPYLSLINSSIFRNYSNPKLYLGVRNKSYHIYREEVDKAKSINGSFLTELIYQDSDGMLNIEKIFNENGPSSTYFISGPPVMIRSFKLFLNEKGVVPDNIRTDDWE